MLTGIHLQRLYQLFTAVAFQGARKNVQQGACIKPGCTHGLTFGVLTLAHTALVQLQLLVTPAKYYAMHRWVSSEQEPEFTHF